MFANLRNKLFVLLALCLAPAVGFCATSCSVATGNVAFGGYDIFSSVNLDSTGQLVVTCRRAGGPPDSTLAIAIGPSASSGLTANRRMQRVSGGNFLRYNLFRDAARTAVWGNRTGVDTVVQTVSVPNNGSAQISATIFSRIPAGQDVPVGTYTDSVMITVTP